jgi:hypothetical protein
MTLVKELKFESVVKTFIQNNAIVLLEQGYLFSSGA